MPPDTPPVVTVIVADDHPVFRDAVAQILGRDHRIKVVAVAKDGREALQLVRDLLPDVAVLDVRMPGLTGPQVAKRIKADELSSRVLLLSEYEDGDHVYSAIEAGATGYVSKAAPADEIVRALLAVARGESVLSPEISGGLVEQIHARAAASAIGLTTREREVLALMVEGCTSRVIGERLFLSTATVKTHTQSLFAKLGVSHRAAAVAEAMRRGLAD